MKHLDGLDERLAPRLRRHPEPLLVLVALVFIAGTAVHAVRYPVLRQPAARAPTPSQPSPTGMPAATPVPDTPRPQPSPQPAPEEVGAILPAGVVRIGPRPGEDVAAYVAARRAALAQRSLADPDEQSVAIVSFTRYVTPAEVDALVAGGGVEVLGVRYRVPAPDAPRERLPVHGDVAATLVPVVHAQADAARHEAAELQKLIDTAQDEAFNEIHARDRDRLLAFADAVDVDGCVCVYAVEVQASVAELLDLADFPDVRVVDLPPPEADLRTVLFVALVPEDTERAGGG